MAKKDKSPVEKTVRDIRRRIRCKFDPEVLVRIVLEGLRSVCSISELCRRKDITNSQYYSWSKNFLEAGKRRLADDTKREATSSEVKELLARDCCAKRDYCLSTP